ncbi:MAG: 50S ribosomal protein L19e [Candidatus Pacearchaeota archaeon]|nr:50S ribosomal protein L19e [Candidatus Pacearchaeota archaeon]
MKTLSLQRRIAARVLGVGENRVWFDPSRVNEIKEAITREDIRVLIKEKAIKEKAVVGIKRRAGKLRQFRKRKGRVRGIGKRKKTLNKHKKEYIRKIRKLRRCIYEMSAEKKIGTIQKRRLMRLSKAGMIKNRKEIAGLVEKWG